MSLLDKIGVLCCVLSEVGSFALGIVALICGSYDKAAAFISNACFMFLLYEFHYKEKVS